MATYKKTSRHHVPLSDAGCTKSCLTRDQDSAQAFQSPQVKLDKLRHSHKQKQNVRTIVNHVASCCVLDWFGGSYPC